jgi:hypothetical protein
MRRLILAVLLMLSLAITPTPAFSASSESCSMSGAEMGMAANHEEMDCCTPECAIVCPAAVLDDTKFGSAGVYIQRAPIKGVPPAQLHSVNPSAQDPPPRA